MTDPLEVPEANPYAQWLLRSYHYWDVYLHQNQTYLGRCYIALKRGEAGDPFLDCTAEEWDELRLILAHDLLPALGRLFTPDIVNYGNLRNNWPHCHWHVVPRYSSERTFVGQDFRDNQWGHNWAPYDTWNYEERTLLAIRDALRQQLDYRPPT